MIDHGDGGRAPKKYNETGECLIMNKKKVIAISSGGGHWVQLLRLRSMLSEYSTTWVTVEDDYKANVPAGQEFIKITDATRWSRMDLVKMVLQVWFIVLRIRPQVIVTTGAAPGLAALQIGKFIGCKTIWIDSIANVDELSMSGRHAKRFADLWLTQWPHLARDNGPEYKGAVL